VDWLFRNGPTLFAYKSKKGNEYSCHMNLDSMHLIENDFVKMDTIQSTTSRTPIHPTSLTLPLGI